MDAAAEQAASCVLSGPAGGAVGAAYAAAASGFDDVLTFDMGGTSTDVAPIRGGEAETTTEAVIAGVPLVGSPVRLDGTRADSELPPPALGEHTREVLTALGLDPPEIARLRSSGVTG